MIKTDLLQFITNNQINKGPTDKGRKSEKAKNGFFEDILRQKKEVSNQLTSNKKNNLKSSPVKNQTENVKEVTDEERIIKEQYHQKDKDTSYNQSEPNKKTEEKNLTVDENNNNILDNVNKDSSVYNLYNYLTSFTTETTNINEELATNDLVFKHDASSISDTVFVDLDSDTAMKQIIGTILKDQEPIVLNEVNEPNDDFVQNLDMQLKQITKQTKQGATETEEKSIELGEIVSEELKSNTVIPKGQENIKEKQIEEQDTNSFMKASFNEGIKFEEKENKGSSIETKNDTLFEEDLDAQNTHNSRLQNIFDHINDNSQSGIEKNIENTFESMVTKEKPIILDKESIFEQIVEKVKVDIDKTDEIRIKLKPDFLGEISLKISAEKGVITAKAYVENYNVKQMMESNLDNLRDSMKELGINFDALDVSVGKDSSFDKNNSQTWNQEQRIKIRKPKLENIPIIPTYEEDIDTFVGGLYSSNGNIDLIV